MYIDKTDPILEGFVDYAPKRTEEEKKKISKTLKDKTSNNPEYRQKKIDELRPMYECYLKFGFEEVIRQYSYRYTQQNFVQSCKAYLPEYVSHQGRKLSQN